MSSCTKTTVSRTVFSIKKVILHKGYCKHNYLECSNMSSCKDYCIVIEINYLLIVLFSKYACVLAATTPHFIQFEFFTFSAIRNDLNDIALLKLDRPLQLHHEDANTLCLPKKNQKYDKTSCTVAGWGDKSKLLLVVWEIKVSYYYWTGR